MARPESLSEDNRGTSISTIKDTKFLNSQNAEILLTAAKKSRDVTKRDRYRNRDGRRRWNSNRLKYSINPKVKEDHFPIRPLTLWKLK